MWFLYMTFVLIAMYFTVKWCHRYVVEEFDDKDVPRLFKNSRGANDGAEDANFDHEADPKEVADDLHKETYNLNAQEGEMAMDLSAQHPNFFEILNAWYQSDKAYDLKGLEKALDIPKSAVVNEMPTRV